MVPGRLDNTTLSKHRLQYLVTGQFKRLKNRTSEPPVDTLQEARDHHIKMGGGFPSRAKGGGAIVGSHKPQID